MSSERRPLGLGRLMDEDELEKMYAGRNQPAPPPPPAPIVIPAPEVTVTPQVSAPDVNVQFDAKSVVNAINAMADRLEAQNGKRPRLMGLTCDNIQRRDGIRIDKFDVVCRWSDE